MSERSPAADLREIIDACDRIERYLVGLTLEQFLASSETGDAVALNLMVIGEAVRRIPPDVLAREPAIPWTQIIALRNRIAHGYASLALEVIWTIATRELTDLKAAVRRLSAAT